MSFDLPNLIARLRAEEPAPQWTVRLALGLLIGYLALRVVAVGIVSAVTSTGGQFVLNPLTANLAGALAGVLGLLLIGAVLRGRISGALSASLRLDRQAGSALVLVIFSLGTAIFVDFVPLMFQTIGLPVYLTGMANANLTVWLVAALHVVIVAPAAEMTLIAGVLYPALAAGRGNLPAIGLSALAYAFVQVFDNPASALLWITSFLAGLYLVGVRAHQKSTRAAIIAAAMFGLFTLFKAMRLFM